MGGIHSLFCREWRLPALHAQCRAFLVKHAVTSNVYVALDMHQQKLCCKRHLLLLRHFLHQTSFDFLPTTQRRPTLNAFAGHVLMLISYQSPTTLIQPTLEMLSTMLGLGRNWTAAAEVLIPSTQGLSVTETLARHLQHKKECWTRRVLREKDAELKDLNKRLSGFQHAWKCNSDTILAQNGDIARLEFEMRRKDALLADKDVCIQGLQDEKAGEKKHWQRLMREKTDAVAAKKATQERLSVCEMEKAELNTSLATSRARIVDLQNRQRKMDALRVDAEKEVKGLDNLNRKLEKRVAEAVTELDVAKQDLATAEKVTQEEEQKVEAAEKAREEAEAKLIAKEEAEEDGLFEDEVEAERQALEAKLSNTQDELQRQKIMAVEERQAFEAKLSSLMDEMKRQNIAAQEAYQALETKLSNSQDELEHQKMTAEEERKALREKLSNSQDELEHQKTAAENERHALGTQLETQKKQSQKLMDLTKKVHARANAASKDLNEMRAERDGDGDGDVIKPSRSQEKLIEARVNLVEALREELRMKDWQMKQWSDEQVQYCEESVQVEAGGNDVFRFKGMASSLPYHMMGNRCVGRTDVW